MRSGWAPPLPPTLAPFALMAAIATATGGWLVTATVQQDFAAYYTAGAAMARGLDPYLNHPPSTGGPWDGVAIFRHSRFLYPPLVAQLFRPLAALPYAVAKAIFTAASIMALLGAAALVIRDAAAGEARRGHAPDEQRRLLPPAGQSTRARMVAALPLLWAAWPPVFLCLERGQVDLLVLAALAVAWHLRARPLAAGALLALAALGKPLVLGVVPLLVVARRPRWAAATLGALVVLAALNVALAGGALSSAYLREVLPRAARFGEGGPASWLASDAEMEAVASDLEQGVARVDGAGPPYRQEIGSFPRNASLPRALSGEAPPPPALTLTIFLALAAALAYGARRRPEHPAWFWGALVAALVAAPVAWAMSLVWALPLSALTLAAPPLRSRAGWMLAVAAAAGMLGPAVPAAWIGAALAAIAAAVLHLVAPPPRSEDAG